MESDHQSGSTESNGAVPRRSYAKLLGILGVSDGSSGAPLMGDRGSDLAAMPSDGGNGPRELTVSDSGTDVVDGVTRLDFEGALSPVVEDEDADSVRVQQQSNPNVVDVREDLGVQPEQDDLWAAVRDHYDSFRPSNRNHLYVVPAGTWFVESDNLDLPAHEFFGLVGKPYATLKVNDQRVDRLMTVGRTDSSLPHAQRTEMRDLRVDISGEYDAGIGRWHTYGYGQIDDVRLQGRRERTAAYGGDRHTLTVDGVTSETTNIVQNCHLSGGETVADRGGSYAFSSTDNRGTNIWKGCQASGFLGGAFYAAADSGKNIYTGCHARNFGGSGFRLSGNDRVQNCQITMTEHRGRPWIGLWVERGSGQVVDGLEVFNAVEKDTEIIRLTQDGRAKLSNVFIDDRGATGRAIRVLDDDRTRTVFEQCTLVDRTSPEISSYAVNVGSSNVTFRDCQFDLESQTDRKRHGILVSRGGTNVDRLTLDGCDVDSDDASLLFNDSGRQHTISYSFFEGRVLSGDRTTLSDVLWIGNRHGGRAVFHGQRTNWKGDFNVGFDV